MKLQLAATLALSLLFAGVSAGTTLLTTTTRTGTNVPSTSTNVEPSTLLPTSTRTDFETTTLTVNPPPVQPVTVTVMELPIQHEGIKQPFYGNTRCSVYQAEPGGVNEKNLLSQHSKGTPFTYDECYYKCYPERNQDLTLHPDTTARFFTLMATADDYLCFCYNQYWVKNMSTSNACVWEEAVEDGKLYLHGPVTGSGSNLVGVEYAIEPVLGLAQLAHAQFSSQSIISSGLTTIISSGLTTITGSNNGTITEGGTTDITITITETTTEVPTSGVATPTITAVAAAKVGPYCWVDNPCKKYIPDSGDIFYKTSQAKMFTYDDCRKICFPRSNQPSTINSFDDFVYFYMGLTKDVNADYYSCICYQETAKFQDMDLDQCPFVNGPRYTSRDPYDTLYYNGRFNDQHEGSIFVFQYCR
ncbi:hypothetical protein BC940DRAFT_332367 [Gongronella butleri]|nr:hypothetical protein BC940DRAFT_332367 [Gongronella butleri]